MTNRARVFAALAAIGFALVLVTGLESTVAAAAVPSGFQDQAALRGLNQPTAVEFSPDGRVFVAEKRGVIKVFDNLDDTTPTVFADLRKNTHDFWDRGLLGLALDPGFPSKPYVYALYTHDAKIGGTAPRWGDQCSNPPGATDDGCVVSGRLSRLQAAGNQATGGEKVLVEDWCQQYPSHSVGSLAFGRDGALYASAGDGASFTFADYGQDGNPRNPCGDPTGGVGGNQTPPTAEGGALRAQDLRTGRDKTGLDGTVIRVDPATGAGLPGNPRYSSPDPNARRIVASGLRNPFRITSRPGTNEIWTGDVGWSQWEEINRLPSPADSNADNFGWPCYEGAGRTEAYASIGLNICNNLYNAGPSAVSKPYYAYNHSQKVVSGESCGTGSSSIAGLAFYRGGAYPTKYGGALFFTDYSRGCIWAMQKGANGLPNPASRTTFATGVSGPVNLKIGPSGDLFYVSLNDGEIRRIRHFSGNQPPVARAKASPTTGPPPLTVNFDGTGSTDADPTDKISYAWDLDGDGAYDDSTAAKPAYTYRTAGNYTVGLRVTDSFGASSTDRSISVSAGNAAPKATIATPASSLKWKVGDEVSFSGSATDPQDGKLAAANLSWELIIHHCATNGTCHEHRIKDYPGVSEGSFNAPDHDYPSYLELRLTAKDSGGLSSSTSVKLDPQTVRLNFQTDPAGLSLSAGGRSSTTPFSRTVIAGSTNSVSAPVSQKLGGTGYEFDSWSDGGARARDVKADTSPATYTATYKRVSGEEPLSKDGKSRAGIYRSGTFYLKNDLSGGKADTEFRYGGTSRGTVPLMGDWNGDGKKTAGIYRSGTFYLKNANEGGRSDLYFRYGSSSDKPVVGDWDGDGKDTIGVVRGDSFYLKNTNGGGRADIRFSYGRATDKPIFGDWNGDGKDTVGVRRGATFYLKNTNAGGGADERFAYGRSSDKPVAGDWDGDSKDSVGIVRGGGWYLKNANTGGGADVRFSYGDSGYTPLVW